MLLHLTFVLWWGPSPFCLQTFALNLPLPKIVFLTFPLLANSDLSFISQFWCQHFWVFQGSIRYLCCRLPESSVYFPMHSYTFFFFPGKYTSCKICLNHFKCTIQWYWIHVKCETVTTICLHNPCKTEILYILNSNSTSPLPAALENHHSSVSDAECSKYLI